MATKKRTVEALLERHGRTYADELGVGVERNTPSELFKLLVACVPMSARISSSIAADAARGLVDAGWTTAETLAGSTWDERVAVLNEAGYARYQERTATMLGGLAEHLQAEYTGDLRRLRDDAGRDPGEIRKRLRPSARRCGRARPRLRRRRDRARSRREGVPELVAALVRVELDDDYDAVREDAEAR